MYQGTVEITDDMVDGTYSSRHIYVEDIYGNRASVYGYEGKFSFTVIPEDSFVVKYVDGCGGEAFAEQRYVVEPGAATPAFDGELHRDGNLFNSWFPELSETVTESVTYTASWTLDTRPIYTVTFTDGSNGTVFDDMQFQVREGDPAPQITDQYYREGYIYAGWDEDISLSVLSDLTYVAQWVPDADYVVAVNEGPVRIALNNPNVSTVINGIKWLTTNASLGSVTQRSMSISSVTGLTVECDFYPAEEGFAWLYAASNYDNTRYASCTVLVTPAEKQDVSGLKVELSEDAMEFDPSGCFPSVSVCSGDVPLVEGRDYTVEYVDNYNAGTASVVVRGISYYGGSVTKEFEIERADIADVVNLGGFADEVYCGTAIEPIRFLVRADGVFLDAGVDYEVTYSDNVDCGTAGLRIEGIGNYNGAIKHEFEIVPAGLEDIELDQMAYVYDGARKSPTVIVRGVGGQALTEGVDYVLDVPDGRIEAGEYVYTATGVGNYSGSVSAALTIVVKTGWQKDNGKWYYYDADGNMVKSKWMKDSKGWVYLGKDGAMATNKWVKDSKGWCYVGDDGYCVANKWVKDSVGWCYLGPDCRMVTDRWVKDSVGWCYLGPDGYAVKSQWRKDSKGWCYLDEKCRLAIGWKDISGKTYWFDSKGRMATGERVIDGVTYTFGTDGALVG